MSVEINTADTLAFKSLPAIGEVFSKRICKYRNILAGFNSISQLM
ncbi:MAG: helix-hairpin-helix domain-containing protein, partial [Flavobacteriia bacterium]|nr:helix-hairpin-helix domain-containing protein [Flavobacteriia bacterium]